MRIVNVSVDKATKSVVCDKERMHVAPYYNEEFRVQLEGPWANKYELDIEFEKNSFVEVDPERSDGTSVMLVDKCHTRGVAKFTIKLTDKDGHPAIFEDDRGEKSEIKALDPHVVND